MSTIYNNLLNIHIGKALKLIKKKMFNNEIYALIIDILELQGFQSAREIQETANQEFKKIIPPAVIINRLRNLERDGEITSAEQKLDGYLLKIYSIPLLRKAVKEKKSKS
jgi:hypothetical protein